MDFQKEQTELAVQARDMAESACHIKGPLFADTVNSLFALHGMRDLGRRLIAAVPEGTPYSTTMDILHGNVEQQLLAALPEADRLEAHNLAGRMMANQAALHARIEGAS